MLARLSGSLYAPDTFTPRTLAGFIWEATHLLTAFRIKTILPLIMVPTMMARGTCEALLIARTSAGLILSRTARQK